MIPFERKVLFELEHISPSSEAALSDNVNFIKIFQFDMLLSVTYIPCSAADTTLMI